MSFERASLGEYDTKYEVPFSYTSIAEAKVQVNYCFLFCFNSTHQFWTEQTFKAIGKSLVVSYNLWKYKISNIPQLISSLASRHCITPSQYCDLLIHWARGAAKLCGMAQGCKIMEGLTLFLFLLYCMAHFGYMFYLHFIELNLKYIEIQAQAWKKSINQCEIMHDGQKMLNTNQDGGTNKVI